MSRNQTRHPANIGIFSAHLLVKDRFLEGWKRYFWKKYCSSNFLTFGNLWIFWFFAKPQFKWKKDIFRKKYHLIRIQQQICHLFEKVQVFFKKSQLFKKNLNFVRIWQICIFHSHSTEYLLQFSDEKITNSKPSDIGQFKSQVQKMHGLSGWFSFHIPAENNDAIIV